MSANEPASEGAGVIDAIRLLGRRRWSFTALFLLALAISGAWISTRPPTFRATATILLETDRPGGLLGDLAAVASLASAPTASRELSILESHSLAREVVSPPSGGEVPRPGIAGYDRRVGLTTTVRDEELTPLFLLRRQLLGGAPPGRPPAHPADRLFAVMEREEGEPGGEDPELETPRRVRVEFLDPRTLRLTSPSLRSRLHLDEEYPREFAFEAGKAIRYRGNVLRLALGGEREAYRGRTFLVERVPEYLAIERLQQRIAVGETARNSGVIRVSVTDTDPWRAAETANAVCENYLADLEERTSQRSSRTIEYIEELLEEERAAFEMALQQILELRSKHPETLDLGAAATALISRLAGLELERLRLAINRHTLSEVVEALKEGDSSALGRLDAAITARLVVDPLTESLLGEIARMEGTVRLHESRYIEDAPLLVEAVETLRALEKRVLAQLESRLVGFAQEDATLDAEYRRIEGELSALPTNELALARPLLVVRAHEEVLPALVRGLQSAEIARTSSQASARYVDHAEAPTRAHSPQIGLGLAMGVTLGLFFAALVVLLAEPRRARPRNAEELEEASGLPVRGVVPRFRNSSLRPPVPGRAIPLRDAPDHPAAEAFRVLQAGLDPLFAAEGGRILGATSTRRGEGRSTMNVDLAVALARSGRRTLLIDGDLRQPTVHQQFSLPLSPGLCDCASGDADWHEFVQETDCSGLRILTAGKVESSPGECLAGAPIRSLLAQARDEFDAIVVDLPPARGIADVHLLGASFDAIFFLCRAGRVRRRDLVACVDDLRGGGLPLIGAVLNAAKR
jgi:polysaccharide biosynthesis transport protein